MEIATILPIKYLKMREDSEYNMCLAHLMKSQEYKDFFKAQAEKGMFVLMDNGVVETDEPLTIEEIMNIAEEINVTEAIIPDAIRDKELTLERGRIALKYLEDTGLIDEFQFLAVPQGSTKEEWKECLLEMLNWSVTTIGISRFVNKYYDSRLEALMDVPELINSDKEIHLLGCAGDPIEMFEIEKEFPGRIRGVDSGIAAIYAQEGIRMDSGAGKPQVDLNFDNEDMDVPLLEDNATWWEGRCLGEV